MAMATNRISLPPLNAVRAFEAAARHQSFRLAAEELFVTPGAVGQQIRSLESHLGIKLFVRTASPLALTASGRTYAQSARLALLQLSLATAQLTTGKRTVTIWAPPTLATRWLVPRLGAFRAGRDDVELRIYADIAEADPARVDVDIVIEHTNRPRAKTSVKLFDEEVFPVCSPALLEKLARPLRADALLAQTLLHTSLHDFWADWLASAGVETNGIRCGPFFNQATVALEAAAAGQGFALASEALVHRDFEEGRLVQPFAQRLRTGWAYRLAAPQGALSIEALSSLKEMLLAY